MKKILAFLLVSVLMVGLFLTGCAPQATLQEGEATKAPAAPADTATAPKEPTTEASVEPIKIGALLDYTGVVAELGPKYEAGIRLAIDDFGGQVAGRPIELITADSGSDVTKAVEKFKDITEKDGVKIVIGPLMGDAHVAIAPLAKEKDVIITSLVNGIYDTIETSGRHYVIYPTTVEAQTYPLGGYAYNELGYKTAATIGSNFAGKIGFVEGFVQGFTEAGGTITQQVWSEPGADDFSGYITSLPKDVDCILYALNGPAEVSKFVYQVRQAGFKVPLLTITQDADYTPEALKELGEVAAGIPGEASYTWQLDTPENKAFVANIEKATGVKPSSNEQNAYALATILLTALEKTGGDDSYAALWPAITSLDIQTPAGRVTFEPEGVAITDMYVTEAEAAPDGEYRLSAPIHIVPQIRDPRIVAGG